MHNKLLRRGRLAGKMCEKVNKQFGRSGERTESSSPAMSVFRCGELRLNSRHSWRQSRQYLGNLQWRTTQTLISRRQNLQLAGKGLMLRRRMAAAKVDDEGTSISAKRVQEISMQNGRAQSPTARPDVISWSVEEVAADDFGDSVARVGCHFQWDVVSIQEGLRKRATHSTFR